MQKFNEIPDEDVAEPRGVFVISKSESVGKIDGSTIF